MELIKKVNELKDEIIAKIKDAFDEPSLRLVQETHLSKKSPLNAMMAHIKELQGDEKVSFGQAINNAKKEIAEFFSKKEKEISDKKIQEKLEKEKIDITLPSIDYHMGGINPFYQIIDEICDIFTSMGYQVKEGPDVETDYYNFERMNIPADHPAREMQDSLYINPTTLLRTHTSP